MGSAPPPPPDQPSGTKKRGWTGGRIVAVVFGGILTLLGIALLLGGGATLWADQTQRDAAGYVHFTSERYRTSTYALATRRFQLDWHGVSRLRPSTILGTVRVRVTPTDPSSRIFVGIAQSNNVGPYLAGVRHATIDELGDARIAVTSGGAPATPPADERFWVAHATGRGTQTLVWPVTGGSWRVVVMNDSGRPGLDLRTDVGATVPVLFWVGVGTLGGGGLFLALGLALVIGGVLRATRRVPG
jgi:hypothetical protein